MILRYLLSAAVAAFPLSEIVLARAKRADPGAATLEDRGSLRLLWFAVGAGVFLAIAAQGVQSCRIPLRSQILEAVAFVLLATGLVIRWVAILTLGRLFTVDVAIHSGHSVVQTGLYRFVRHPSYSGLMLAFLGLGVYFENWLSMLLLLVPIALAVGNRVRKEERALSASLGSAYAAYCARTKRFVPGVF